MGVTIAKSDGFSVIVRETTGLESSDRGGDGSGLAVRVHSAVVKEKVV
jgi:hypothetical protein